MPAAPVADRLLISRASPARLGRLRSVLLGLGRPGFPPTAQHSCGPGLARFCLRWSLRGGQGQTSGLWCLQAPCCVGVRGGFSSGPRLLGKCWPECQPQQARTSLGCPGHWCRRQHGCTEDRAPRSLGSTRSLGGEHLGEQAGCAGRARSWGTCGEGQRVTGHGLQSVPPQLCQAQGKGRP